MQSTVNHTRQYKAHCPHCDAPMAVRYESFGEIVGCAACKQMMQVPIPVAQIAEVDCQGVPAYLDGNEEFYDI